MKEQLVDTIRYDDVSKPKTTYSDIIKGIQEETKEKKEILVLPKDGTQIEDAKKVKQVVMKTVDPGKENIKILSIRRSGKKGVIIQTNSNADKDKLMTGLMKENLEKEGLKLATTGKLLPKIIIFSVDRNEDMEEFKRNIYRQNLKDTSITEEQFSEGCKFKFTTGRRENKYCHKVFEVIPEIREKIMEKEKVYIGWESQFVKDYMGVSRCYNCQRFGHVAKVCREKQPICAHCAQNRHTDKDCPNQAKEERCANCFKFGKHFRHSTHDKDCPAYIHALEKTIYKTDYSKN
ncbi:hypothetical protein J437_LFUL018295 [Ladona fulva]|uniref:CCHC-type domain-containing protein n=1 Tax=Ladona fulva TaxID=123851 RepID=A0A8K0KNY1_LADFU|nr:hypothetical protein J437_LFUL018295 [Ladona fulva]